MANAILVSGLIFLFGLALSKILEKFKLPAVTSYLIAGVIIGPYVLNLVPAKLINLTTLVANVILSIVAFSLGRTFTRRQIETIGRAVMLISWGEVLGAFLLVSTVLYLAGMPLYTAILFGGIAPATAPAATIMVIREYRAKGIFTETLLGVVAIDDAWGIMVFALAEAVAKVLVLPGVSGSIIIHSLIFSLIHILGALALGAALGVLLALGSKLVKNETNILLLVFGFILLNTGLALHFNLSDLLANMALGAALANIKSDQIYFNVLKRIDWPLYVYFFVLTGSSLEIPLLKHMGFFGLLYLFSRPFGEYIGAFLGALIGKMEKRIRNYIGLGLVPQAGVALGLAILVRNEFQNTIGHAFLTTIVATTILYEIFGPLFTKYALQKTGEIYTG